MHTVFSRSSSFFFLPLQWVRLQEIKLQSSLRLDASLDEGALSSSPDSPFCSSFPAPGCCSSTIYLFLVTHRLPRCPFTFPFLLTLFLPARGIFAEFPPPSLFGASPYSPSPFRLYPLSWSSRAQHPARWSREGCIPKLFFSFPEEISPSPLDSDRRIAVSGLHIIRPSADPPSPLKSHQVRASLTQPPKIEYI